MKKEKEVKKEEIEQLENEIKEENSNELEEKIILLEKEKEELFNKVKLAQADLVNYRKRKDEEVSSMLKYANEGIIKELIILVDNFERAIKLDDDNLDDDLSKFLSGFKLMYANLVDILKKYGVEIIDRRGEIFDANLEEALLTDNLENHEDEEIIEVLQKGYKLHDKIIRPASVKINKK